jgi:hypothetical protein
MLPLFMFAITFGSLVLVHSAPTDPAHPPSSGWNIFSLLTNPLQLLQGQQQAQGQGQGQEHVINLKNCCLNQALYISHLMYEVLSVHINWLMIDSVLISATKQPRR